MSFPSNVNTFPRKVNTYKKWFSFSVGGGDGHGGGAGVSTRLNVPTLFWGFVCMLH